MSARIAPIDDPAPDVARILARGVSGDGKFGVSGGRPFAIFSTLAHNPKMLEGSNQMGAALLATDLPPREREIVICRVAWNTRSLYEYAAHRIMALGVGMTEREIAALASLAAAGFTGDERTLIDMADELCAYDGVSDATWARLLERWTPANIIELVMLAGFYRMIAGFLNSAGVQPDDPTASWPEDATS